jgi:myosin heavy subunit
MDFHIFVKIVYTHVGAVLVAVNPFEALAIYSMEEVMKALPQ